MNGLFFSQIGSRFGRLLSSPQTGWPDVFRLTISFAALAMVLADAGIGEAKEPARLKWKVQLLGIDGNEGIDVGDFNKDGKLDVIAGRNWYAAPDFTPRPVRTIEDWNGYVQSNGDFAYDVDQDGWLDVIAGSFVPTEVFWYRNPGPKALALGKMWPKKLLADTKASQNEGQVMHDLDGDGKPEWVVNSWRKNSPMLVWKLQPGKQPKMTRAEINPKGNGHGMGFGDLNGDGREDIISGLGWYERPAGDIFAQTWKYHADWEFHASVPVSVRDLDGDGRNDIIWGKGHDFGLIWWQQLPPKNGKLQFRPHTIDKTFSQPHCLHWADLDGDGTEELITGKRFYAHNGKDPGGEMKPCLYYYRWDKSAKSFSKHIVNEGSVGTGLQIRTADLNGDGRLDIAVAGKSGTYIVWNQGTR